MTDFNELRAWLLDEAGAHAAELTGLMQGSYSDLDIALQALIDTANGYDTGHPKAAYDLMMWVLWGTVAGGVVQPPPEFWATPIGAVMLSADLKINDDELLTAQDAAVFLRGEGISQGDIVWVGRLVQQGRLNRYNIAGVTPYRAGRYKRSELEAIKKAADESTA